jgi:nucleotide-binding universal stress UspA family protein
MNTPAIIIVALLVGAAVALAALRFLRPAGPARSSASAQRGSARILFPFTADGLSQRALDAALRLARAEGATVVPVFLARVPLRLPLDTPLPRQSNVALPMLEAIEQRAARFEVPVDARIERGRSHRHALRQTIEHERFDRIVIAASGHNQPGFDAHDVAWLIDGAPGELLIVRPDPESALSAPSTDGTLGLSRAGRVRAGTGILRASFVGLRR